MRLGNVVDAVAPRVLRTASLPGRAAELPGYGRLLRPRELGSRPTVSVVIPCYNYGRYLRQAVESAVGQEGVEVDVVVVDDASSDETPVVARALAAEHPNVRVITHRTNAGMIRTFNDGLRAAEGTYTLLISADDLLTPGALARATALLEHHPEVGMAYGFPRNFSGDPPPAVTAVNSWTVWPGDRWIELCTRRSHSIVHSPEAVVRTSVQREVGYYREDLPRCPDYEMWLRFAHVSAIGRVNGPDQAYRRLHEENFTRTVNAGVLADLSTRLESAESYFRRLPDTAPTRRRRARLRRSIATEALLHARQVLRQDPSSPEARDLLAFAEAAAPATARSAKWRTLRSELADPALRPPLAARASAALRPAWRRATWHRWRVTGM